MTEPDLETLIARLAHGDPMERRDARLEIESHGSGATAAVAAVLESGEPLARWEAAKALTVIATPDAVPALIDALLDEEAGVRWLAAEALVTVGDSALGPLLRHLVQHADNHWFRDGAHHVLKSLVRPETAEVVKSLEGRFQDIAVPVAADRALKQLGYPSENTG